jgi:hypothetical protein
MKIYEILAWIMFGVCLGLLILCVIDNMPKGITVGLMGMGCSAGAGVPLSMRSADN